jgi:hypothetical protein
MDVGFTKKIIDFNNMKKFVFFSYAHKGDIFLSRSFIEHIIESFDAEFYYSHYWGEYLLKDLDVKYIPLEQIPKIQHNNEHAHNFIVGDTVYINTWVGKYASIITPGYCECTLKTLHSLVYPQIFNFLSEQFNIDLQLKSIEEYLGCKVNYSYYNIDSIDDFIKKEERKKVLFCNGPSLSNQCSYSGDLSEIIESVSKLHPNICFITTHKIDICQENVKYTGDIIANDGQDLYEISYLSKFCNLMVGRYSGPFIFTNATMENISDKNKKFLCFGDKAIDCHPYQMEFDSEFIFEEFTTLDNLKETILSLI